MLQNAYFLAKIGADTAENEQHFAEILPTAARDLRAGERRRPARAQRAVPGTEVHGEALDDAELHLGDL